MTMAPTSETLNGCVQNAADSNDSATLPVEKDSHRGSKKPRVIQSPAALSILGVLVFFVSCTNIILPYVHIINNIEVSNSNSNTNTFTETSSPSARQRQCTSDELLVIKRQLPPDDCLMHGHEPWKHKCSLSYATRCPDPVWLDQYYTRIHVASGYNNRPPPTPFLALFVGCNKGFDALNALRMGSGKPDFDKRLWNDTITQHGKLSLHRDVCNEVSRPQFDLPMKTQNTTSSASSSTSMLSQVHCIEAMPTTARAHETKYDTMGFIVSHAALAKEDGFVSFPANAKVGVENKGISNTNCDGGDNDDNEGLDSTNCINVTKYSLDSYMEKFVPTNVPINYLSVDVEGWDFEVLLGGKRNSLARVQYLEFEYNWVGPWKERPLLEVIEFLDAQFGFTCYWAGFNNTIWRITSCWLDHYESHCWSNIACVNRNFDAVNDLAEDMEDLFMETLRKGEDAVRDYEHRFKRSDG